MKRIFVSVLRCKYVVPVVAFVVVLVGLYLTTQFNIQSDNGATDPISVSNNDVVVIDRDGIEGVQDYESVIDGDDDTSGTRVTNDTQIIIETVLKDGTVNRIVDDSAKYFNADKSQVEERIRSTVDETNTISDGRIVEFSDDKVVVQFLMVGVDEFPSQDAANESQNVQTNDVVYIVRKNAADCLSVYYGDGQTLVEQTDKSVYDLTKTQQTYVEVGLEFNTLDDAMSWINSPY